MSYIQDYIKNINDHHRKALSVYLTAGYPDKNSFTDLAKTVLDSGADILELGIPFSDPLADGPTIQASSKFALDCGVNTKIVLKYAEEISKYSTNPIILMGYANPIIKYGTENFLRDASNAGVKGLIVPDVPLEEYDAFFNTITLNYGIDTILLTTPTSSEERIKQIDEKSTGFVYCVSVTGITGTRDGFSKNIIENLTRTRSMITKNKMLIGFGISNHEDIKSITPFCDGVIVGSAIIKSLSQKDGREKTIALIKILRDACE